MNKNVSTIFFALFLPISTGIACAIYERLVVRSGLTVGQYVVVNTSLYLFPFVIWTFLKGELNPSVMKVSLNGNYGLLISYTILSILISISWWYCTNIAGVIKSSTFEASYPIFVIVFSVVINRKPITLREIIAVCFVVIGIIMLLITKKD